MNLEKEKLDACYCTDLHLFLRQEVAFHYQVVFIHYQLKLGWDLRHQKQGRRKNKLIDWVSIGHNCFVEERQHLAFRRVFELFPQILSQSFKNNILYALILQYLIQVVKGMSKQDEEISYATNRKGIKKMKVVFIGDQYTGKTSIINRFMKNTFDSSSNPTIGIDFVSKNVTFNGKILRLQLWDTAGQERFRSLIPNYIRDCHAAFILYDIVNEESYNNIEKWIDFLKENRGDDVLSYVIGNKLDLAEDRVVDSETAAEKFKGLGLKYWQTSAKNGENIDGLFEDLLIDLLKIEPNQIMEPLQIQKSKIISFEKEEDKAIRLSKTSSQNQKQSKKNPNSVDSRRIKQKDCC